MDSEERADTTGVYRSHTMHSEERADTSGAYRSHTMHGEERADTSGAYRSDMQSRGMRRPGPIGHTFLDSTCYTISTSTLSLLAFTIRRFLLRLM